jgi:hypothetical protein
MAKSGQISKFVREHMDPTVNYTSRFLAIMQSIRPIVRYHKPVHLIDKHDKDAGWVMVSPYYEPIKIIMAGTRTFEHVGFDDDGFLLYKECPTHVDVFGIYRERPDENVQQLRAGEILNGKAFK